MDSKEVCSSTDSVSDLIAVDDGDNKIKDVFLEDSDENDREDNNSGLIDSSEKNVNEPISSEKFEKHSLTSDQSAVKDGEESKLEICGSNKIKEASFFSESFRNTKDNNSDLIDNNNPKNDNSNLNETFSSEKFEKHSLTSDQSAVKDGHSDDIDDKDSVEEKLQKSSAMSPESNLIKSSRCSVSLVVEEGKEVVDMNISANSNRSDVIQKDSSLPFFHTQNPNLEQFLRQTNLITESRPSTSTDTSDLTFDTVTSDARSCMITSGGKKHENEVPGGKRIHLKKCLKSSIEQKKVKKHTSSYKELKLRKKLEESERTYEVIDLLHDDDDLEETETNSSENEEDSSENEEDSSENEEDSSENEVIEEDSSEIEVIEEDSSEIEVIEQESEEVDQTVEINQESEVIEEDSSEIEVIEQESEEVDQTVQVNQESEEVEDDSEVTEEHLEETKKLSLESADFDYEMMNKVSNSTLNSDDEHVGHVTGSKESDSNKPLAHFGFDPPLKSTSNAFLSQDLASICSGKFENDIHQDCAHGKESTNIHKIIKDFFDYEAELSGEDEIIEDHDKDDVDQEVKNLIDDHDLPSEEVNRDEIVNVHIKQMQDDDSELLKEFQEKYLPEGDLQRPGPSRIRHFAWKNSKLPSSPTSTSDEEESNVSALNNEKVNFTKEEDARDLEADSSQILRHNEKFFLQKRSIKNKRKRNNRGSFLYDDELAMKKQRTVTNEPVNVIDKSDDSSTDEEK